MEIFKKISSGAFGLAILCFLLPFVSVSCSGQKIVTFTGIQLVTGTSMKEPRQLGSQGEDKKIKGDPLAMIALACGVLGLGFSFLKSGKSAIIPSVLGGIGIVMLLIFQANLRDTVLKEGGPLQLSMEIGYWLTALFYVVATSLNGICFLKNKGGT